MKQDRGTSRGPRAAQVLLNVLAAIALVAFGSVISMSAASAEADSEETAAAWPARWTEYTQVDGTPIRDVDGDVTPSSVDLVSGACETCTGPTGSVAWASDGSNAFFRIRLGLTSANGGGRLPRRGVRRADRRRSGAVRAAVGVHRTGAQQTVYVSDAVGDVVMQAHTSHS
jgi:hypothetical protein